jgi:hypothetical protein
MSERFYEKFLSFFFGLAILFIVFSATGQFLIIYFLNQNIIFYYAYLGMLLFSTFYGFKYFLAFRDFRESVNEGLFSPKCESQNEKPLDIDVENEDLPIKVCLYYEQGASLVHIQNDLGLTHPTQAQRLLRKGLGILLKEHREIEAK